MEENIKVEETKEYLECILTTEEHLDRAQKLAKANEDLQSAEDRKKDIMAGITAEIKKHEASIGVLTRIVAQGKEYRNVPCEWRINYTRGVKHLVRLDTEETIKTDTVAQKERQAALM